MRFDCKLPNHFFFKNWKHPKKIKELHPFISERGAKNNDKVYDVVELEYENFKVQICIDGNNCWIKKC